MFFAARGAVRTTRLLLPLALSVCSVGCLQPVSDDNPGSDDTGCSVRTSSPARCDVMGTAQPVTNECELKTFVSGRWRFCGSSRAIMDGDGLEFDVAGKKWFRLTLNASGALERSTTGLTTGELTWGPEKTGGFAMQVNFRIESGGVPAHLTFTEEPRMLRATTNLPSSPVYAFDN